MPTLSDARRARRQRGFTVSFFHTLLTALAIASPARAEEHQADVWVDPKDHPWSVDASTPCTGPCVFHLPANGMHRVQIGDVHQDVWVSEQTMITYRPRIAPVFYAGAAMTGLGATATGLVAYGLVKSDDAGSINGPTGTALGIFFGVSIAAAITGAILMIVSDDTLTVKSWDQPSRRPAPSVEEGVMPGPLARHAPATPVLSFAF